jgi:uncharacterized protein with GYD domain
MATRVALFASCQRDTPTFRKIKGSDCAFGGRAIRKSNNGGVAMLFCLTANYTPKALDAMGKNPSNRREAVEKLLTAAGGKLVAMYGTIAEGPGAMAIFDVDPAVAPAVVGVVASSEAVQNVKMQRLFSGDEVAAVRQKRTQLQASYRAPGQ